MSLQRGENVTGWSGVTKNMTIDGEERAAWRFSMFSTIVALIIAGIAVYMLAETDIPVIAKTLLGLLALLFALVLICGIFSVQVRRIPGGQMGYARDTVSTAAPAASDHASTPSAAEVAAQAAARAAEQERARVAAAEAEAAAKAAADAQAAEAAAAARAAEEAADQERQRQAAAEAEAAAAAKAKDMGPDRDGDGVAEGKDEGTRPEALDGPRGGQADDLKLIKGVGPKLEQLCNSLGFYHFDQIANWTSDEVAWVDSNLEGFSGRVTRDEWVSQAKILAEGGTTEFAERQKD